MSSLALELLAPTGLLAVHRVRARTISTSLLLSLASLQVGQVTELDTDYVCCTTEEDGRALVSLLRSCKK